MAVDIYKEIQNPKLVKKLKREYWEGNNYYGLGNILKKYAGLPYWIPLNFRIQHGIKFFSVTSEDNVKEQLSFYLPKGDSSLFLMYSDKEKEFVKSYLGNKDQNIKNIGAPIIYLDPFLEKVKKENPIIEKKGTVAFPSKGTHFSNVVTDYTAYADMLDNLPEKYKPIKVCMYYLDIERGKDKPFREKGFEVVQNGKLLSQDFLQNFYLNTLSCEYATSNDLLSSPVYYSIYFGLKFFEFGPNVKYENLEEDWHSAYAKEREESKKLAPYRFPIEDVENIDRQRQIANKELGVKHKMSKSELRKFILSQLDYQFIRKIFKPNNKQKTGMIKRIIKLFLPPIFIKVYRKFLPPTSNPIKIKENIDNKAIVGWSGKYNSWKEAQSECSGYDNSIIIDKVLKSTLLVKNGMAAYERDSVTFDKIEYNWSLITTLLYIAASNQNELSLIDFGGALGSSYFQNRRFLDILKLEWNIVEQSHFVEKGREYITDDTLSFFYSIEECLDKKKPSVLIVSSVIQYLENPYLWIDKILSYNFEYIIFDRTAFVADTSERLTVQQVHEPIYEASYPTWFFNEEKFLQQFSEKYELVTSYKQLIEGTINFEDNKKGYWNGFWFKKIK
ncbi:methyltransferase, TIGR04325 family [Bernardetia sp. MNP-M8]|uniref:methyltransferase, TIGR04325 family n=1 Tax=Bernardetia sp. MNP-M8 TaxID=3127470 RepID=UPI0030CC8F05